MPGRPWIKLYCRKWLDGTMSYELTDAQVGVWSKLLALAGEYADYNDSNGLIPLPLEAIRRRIKSEARVFERAIKRLEETGRIQLLDEGVLISKFKAMNFIPSRAEIYDDENPEKARERKRNYKRQQTTTNDYLEKDKEKDIDITILLLKGERTIEQVMEWIKGRYWYAGWSKHHPQFQDSDLFDAVKWLKDKNETRKRLSQYLSNWANKIPAQAPKGRVPDKYTDEKDL